MNFYQSEIQRIKSVCFSNDNQLQTVISIKNYIDSNYDNDLNLDFLAHTMLISKFHLLRLFKKHYGQTPRQYLIDKRIEKSKEHLIKGDSVTETCFAVGFESVSSFSVLFKNKLGESPRAFQKKAIFEKL